MAKYNLADIIRYNHAKALDFNNGEQFTEDSIAYQYVSQCGQPITAEERDVNTKTFIHPDLNFELLYKIIQSINHTPLPNDTFCLHLRLGDVFLRGAEYNQLPSPADYMGVIKKYNLKDDFKNCAIVCSPAKTTKDKKWAKQNLYLREIIEGLNDLSLRHEIVTQTVDEDFLTLATAKCFVAGYRGFSWLAASVNPNRVIWDIQNPPQFFKPDSTRPNTLPTLIAGLNFHLKISGQTKFDRSLQSSNFKN